MIRMFRSRYLPGLILAMIVAIGIVTPGSTSARIAPPMDGRHPPLHARHHDRIIFDVSAEEWVRTTTARVVVTVNAAVAGDNASTMRTSMLKAVQDVAAAKWRLVGFNRHLGNTGLEQWHATFEARLSETALGGLSDRAKRKSKPGMKIHVQTIDFSPTLAERQATLTHLRGQLYKMADANLKDLAHTLPGRTWRIALIDFAGHGNSPQPYAKHPRMLHARRDMHVAEASANSAPVPPMEKAEKVVLTARVILKAEPTYSKGIGIGGHQATKR